MPRIGQAYGLNQGTLPLMPPPQPFANAPTSSQTNYDIGQIAYTPANSPTAFYIYGGAGNWVNFATNSGDITSIIGTAPIAASTVSGVATISMTGPANVTTLTNHGVILGRGTSALGALAVAATGTLLSGVTGADPAFTASPSVTGNMTAATGFVATTAGAGITLNSGTTSGTTTATLNGRSGQITITTPTINAGSTFAFTITNSSITGSSTQVLYGLTGGTTGAAITIQSVANTASQSVVTVMNASAVTNSTGSLVLTFLVLN